MGRISKQIEQNEQQECPPHASPTSHPPQASNPPLTVSQLTNAIKLSLESSFSTVYLQGEITNFKVQASGHFYFSLKDLGAQIAAVMFKGDASKISPMPKAGDQVIVRGELNVYPPKGNYQLIVRELKFAGLGELLQKLELLKVKLHQMGWFKAARKKPLPKFPKTIGVVTSPTGAVIQDILHVLSRRFSGFHLILSPVKVQGDGAAEEIARAIEQFNEYALADVLIIGRGGGSLEDLWAFNEEVVASAIFHSKIPIISAVGHETDHCIADYVADVRAPTPSAAAEIVVAEKSQQLDYLREMKKRMQQTLCHMVQKNRYRLDGVLKHPLISRPQAVLEWRMQKADELSSALDQRVTQLLERKKERLHSVSCQAASLQPINRILHFKERFATCSRSLEAHIREKLRGHRKFLCDKALSLDQAWQTRQIERRGLFSSDRMKKTFDYCMVDIFKKYQTKLEHTITLLASLDPKNILKKGYSILFAENSSHVIHSVAQLQKKKRARLLLTDGEAIITINEVISYERTKPS